MRPLLLLAYLLAPLALAQQSAPSAYQKPPSTKPSTLSVRVNVASLDSKPEILLRGTCNNVISEEERILFGITDKPLKRAVEVYKSRPTYVFVRSSGSDDLYQSYNWPEVHRLLKPVNATVTNTGTTVEMVAMNNFINNSTQDAVFDAQFNSTDVEIVKNTWSSTTEHEITTNLSISINLTGKKGDTQVDYSYIKKFGSSETFSQTNKMGRNISVSVVVPPGKGAVATLTASKGTMVIDVFYEISLTGRVIAYFVDPVDSRVFWAYHINHLLKAAGLPQTIPVKETLKVQFYYDFKVVLNDEMDLKDSPKFQNETQRSIF